MPLSESTILERIHVIETTQALENQKLSSLEDWIHDIHKTVKALEKKAYMLLGALAVFEVLLKFWK